MTTQIVTFGCRLNSYETEVMRKESTAAGLDELKNGAFIFNTCAVTNEAVRQARQAIRKVRRDHPKARIIVTGCAAQTLANDFVNMEEVDLIIGNDDKLKSHSYRQLPEFGVNNFEKIRVNDIMEVREIVPHMIHLMEGKTRAFVQVQNGCDHRCTFCIIPFGRGPSRSVPMGAIIEQIKQLTANGYNEIILTGVDLTSYGSDLPGTPPLGKLVKTILRLIPDLARLRLSSIDSIEADEELLELLSYEPRLMPHLHLSLQSGDNMILKRMKRRHSREDALKFCHHLREKRPEFTFGADIIAGFPTETEGMFHQTLNIISECQISHAHIFPFSPRQGTPAARMPQLNRSIIKQRAASLREKARETYLHCLQKSIGTVKFILVEDDELGHSENFLLTKLQNGRRGKIEKCKIVGHNGEKLLGEIIEH